MKKYQGQKQSLTCDFFLQHFSCACTCEYKWEFNTIRLMYGGWEVVVFKHSKQTSASEKDNKRLCFDSFRNCCFCTGPRPRLCGLEGSHRVALAARRCFCPKWKINLSQRKAPTKPAKQNLRPGLDFFDTFCDGALICDTASKPAQRCEI